MNFCSGMPLGKVHELTFLWFGLPGRLLIFGTPELLGMATCRGRVLGRMRRGGFTADARHDQDTSYRVSRARRMAGMLARAWAQGQKDRRAALPQLVSCLC